MLTNAVQFIGNDIIGEPERTCGVYGSFIQNGQGRSQNIGDIWGLKDDKESYLDPQVSVLHGTENFFLFYYDFLWLHKKQ